MSNKISSTNKIWHNRYCYNILFILTLLIIFIFKFYENNLYINKKRKINK